jgi:hypothetical protein
VNVSLLRLEISQFCIGHWKFEWYHLAMRWFYTKLGEGLKHGLVEDVDLHKMAEKGELSREDLIWGEESGTGWALAETLHGLFPEEKHVVALEQEAEEVAEVLPAQALQSIRGDSKKKKKKKSRKKRKGKKGRGFFFILLIVAAVVAWQYRDNLIEKMPIELREKIPMPVDEEAVAAEAEEAAAELADAKEKAVAAKVVADGKGRLNELNVALADGTLDKAGARELMNLWFEHGDLGLLPKQLSGILDAGDGVSEAVYLSVMNMSAVINDKKLVARTVNDYQARLTGESAPEICVEMARLCCDKISDTRAVALVDAFLGKQSKAAGVWLEKSAMQAADGAEKDALDSLKKAVKAGDAGTKAAAIADERFDSLRENSAFKKYVGK